jgi:hypothetical protein
LSVARNVVNPSRDVKQSKFWEDIS